MSDRKVPVAYREPFDFGSYPYVDMRPQGETILQIVNSIPNLHPAFYDRGKVCINGEVVPRVMWAHVRPKPATDRLPIAVTLHWSLGRPGGSGGGLKSIIGVVAALALVVITGGIAAGFAAPLLGASFGAGTLGASLLAGAVGIAGALAISALTAPPTSGGTSQTINSISDNNTDQKESSAASGNILDKGGAIPRVLGTRKVFPPLAGEPIVELIGEDEIVEALLILNGPHQITDIRNDGVSISTAEDITVETREGWEYDTPLTTISRQGRTITPQLELSSHRVNLTSQTLLLHPSNPSQDLPIWHGVATRNAQDEIWLHLMLPQGLSQAAGTSATNIPIRMRMRKRGNSAWINFPEFHVSDATIQQLRKAILIKWKAGDPLEPVPATAAFVYANVTVPMQTVAPATFEQWIAHPHFSEPSGDVYLNSTNGGTTRIKNVNLFSNRIEFSLSEATFPKGVYEIQIKRGMAYNAASFTGSTYAFSGVVWDLFNYQSTSSPAIVLTRSNLADRVLLTRVISIWNDYPVKKQGFALIALKARNRTLQNVSMQASGYVQDWNGSGWDNWTTTSNPAPHYRDVLSGAQNIDPLPSDLRDDVALVEWRTLCIDNAWTCDSIVNDARTQDVLSLLASCGYAKPYQSDVYGVTVDDDRSNDVPVQVFSRRNTTNVRFEKSYPRPPYGFLVTYRDNDLDDDQAQTTVYQRDPSIADATALESITYDGIVDLEKVRARAQFDLDQANLRSTFYYFDTDIESLMCRRGSLVALEHDILSKRSGDGYVKSKIVGSSPLEIAGLILDSEIPVTNQVDMHLVADMHLVTDMHDVGVTTGIVIRRNDGTLSTHTLSNITGSTATLTFAIPIAATSTIEGYADTNGKYGSMIVSGELTSIYRRLLVAGIIATKELQASLVLVDEAQGLRGEVLTLMDGTTSLLMMNASTPLRRMG